MIDKIFNYLNIQPFSSSQDEEKQQRIKDKRIKEERELRKKFEETIEMYSLKPKENNAIHDYFNPKPLSLQERLEKRLEDERRKKFEETISKFST